MRREFRESAVKVPRFPRARHRVCCVPYINGLPVKVHKCMRTDDLVIPPRDTRSRSRNGTDDLREFFARIDRKEQHVTFGPRRAKCIADRFTGLWKLARCREGNKSANSAKNRWGNFSLLSCEKNQSNDRNERETFEMRNQIAKFLNQCHISSLFLSLSLSLSFSLSLSLSLSLVDVHSSSIDNRNIGNSRDRRASVLAASLSLLFQMSSATLRDDQHGTEPAKGNFISAKVRSRRISLNPAQTRDRRYSTKLRCDSRAANP